MRGKHLHAEAYCLMAYRCRDGHDMTIWNSRDGVTPFIVRCRTCQAEATHVDWHRDVYAPDHVPKPGDLIFVDLTESRARAWAKKHVVDNWDREPYPLRDMVPGATQDEVIEVYVHNMMSQTGQPHLEEFRP